MNQNEQTINNIKENIRYYEKYIQTNSESSRTGPARETLKKLKSNLQLWILKERNIKG